MEKKSILATLSLEIPAVETDKEGKLRGGFCAMTNGTVSSTATNQNCDCNCSCDTNYDCNCNCACDKNTNCNCNCKTPAPTTQKPTDAVANGLGIGFSFLF